MVVGPSVWSVGRRYGVFECATSAKEGNASAVEPTVKAQTLTLSSAQKETLAAVQSIDGRLVVLRSLEEPLQNALENWIAKGFYDWVGEGEETHRRFTSPNHPEFLSRLGSYIHRQTGLQFNLDSSETTPLAAIAGVIRALGAK